MGLPNRHGGFEAFLEHCALHIAKLTRVTLVTCYSGAYSERDSFFRGVRRIFICVPANGGLSVLHDLIAFLYVFGSASHIVVLGVSGGPWFPFFRLACSLFGKRLLVNIDGVEWQRGKFSKSRRLLLRCFDYLTQVFLHKIIYDDAALKQYVVLFCQKNLF